MRSLVTKLKHGLFALAIALPASFGVATQAAHAATPSITISPAATNLTTSAAGQSFTVSVMADPAGNTIRGWQFSLTWDPAVLTMSSSDVNLTDTFLNSQKPSGANMFPNSGTVASGSLTGVGDSYLGGTGGATAPGELAKLTFHTVALANNATFASSALTFVTTGSSATFLVDAGSNQLATSTPSGSVNDGPVPAASLVVQSPTTAGVSGNLNSFNVTFVVANTGSAGSSATTASVSARNATPPASTSVNVPALAAGANSGTLTVGPFVLSSGQTTSTVTISVAGGGSAQTAYQHAALSSTGQTPIDASLAGFLKLTAPGAVGTFQVPFVLTAGQTNTEAGHSFDDLNVKSNVNWQVTVSGDNTGHLAQYDGTNYLSPAIELLQPLGVRYDSQPDVNLSDLPQNFVSGTTATSNATTGNDYGIAYDQFVGFNDVPVNAPNDYHIVITWAASGTF